MIKKENVVKIACLLVFLIGIIITIASLYYHLNKTHIGLAFTVPPIVYLLISKRAEEKEEVSNIKNSNSFVLLTALFFISISVALLSWHSELYTRPLSFFVVIAFSCAILLWQIFIYNNEKHVPVILLETVIVGLFLRASIYFEFPTVYGYDPFFHIASVKEIVTQGFITPQLLNYVNFPYTHIFTASVAEITDIGLKNAYFTIAILEIVGSLFVFLIAKKLINTRIGLISAMLIVLAPYNLFWGYWIIPMSLGLVFFMIILYLFIKKEIKPSINLSLLLIFFCLSSIIVHAIAPFIAWITLVLLFVGYLLYKILLDVRKDSSGFKSVNLIILFGIALFSYWMYTTRYQGLDQFSTFLGSLVESLNKMDLGSVTSLTLTQSYSPISIFLRDLPFIILLFFAILGSLLMLNKKLNKINFALIFSFFSLICLIYGLSFVGIGTILPDRWFTFIEVLMIIPAAYGIYLLTFSQKNSKIRFIIASLVIFIFAFSTITTPLNNGDNPLYAEELSDRAALLTSEVAAANFLQLSNNSPVAVNSKYAIIDGYLIDPRNLTSLNNKILVIRNYDMEKGFLIPLFGSKGELLEKIYPDYNFSRYLGDSNKLYANGKVRIYYTAGGNIR